MKTISAKEFKTHFTDVLKQLKSGEEFAITSGENKDIVGYFISDIRQQKRELGILEGTAIFTFNDDFETTNEEFLNYNRYVL